MKQKKSRFVLIWLLICLVLLAASFLVPGREKGETIQTAMRDAVLHDVNQIDFLGLRPVNPGFISAFVVMAVLLVAALCIRIFVIPRFKYVPGKFQLVLEQFVGMFDGLAKTNSPWRNSFLGAYVFAAAAYIFVGALLSGLLVTELVYYYAALSYVVPVVVGVLFTLLHALIQSYVLTMLTALFYGEMSEPKERQPKPTAGSAKLAQNA